jgi:hypothetical protein
MNFAAIAFCHRRRKPFLWRLPLRDGKYIAWPAVALHAVRAPPSSRRKADVDTSSQQRESNDAIRVDRRDGETPTQDSGHSLGVKIMKLDTHRP